MLTVNGDKIKTETLSTVSGYTQELSKRLERHNRKGSPYTSRGQGEWKLVYSESFVNKNDALLRERQIKSYKSRQYLENLIRCTRTGQVAQW